MSEKTFTINTPEGDITLSTGKFAKRAAGSVYAQKGGTVVFTAVTVDPRETKQDFFPLTVEYLEKMYAQGTISGSKVNKREGFPSEGAIIKGRQVDHTIRPLFPKAFKNPVNVIITVMANDGINDPEELSVLSASVALMMSPIPFAGPAASVIVGVDKNDALIINPGEGVQDFVGGFAVAGSNGKLLSIEGWGKELSEETMDKILDASMERIEMLNQAQIEFVSGMAKPKLEVSEDVVKPELKSKVEENALNELKELLYKEKTEEYDRNFEMQKLAARLTEEWSTEDAKIEEADVFATLDYMAKKIMRKGIMEENKRLSGRGMEEIRPLSAEVDVLPTVHGSAVFNRGLTQSLTVVTLASTTKSKSLDDMSGEELLKGFMHHYSMPPFSTGESGRVQYKPGRREIGHGNIGENALRNLVPDQDNFPYTIRAVSEIMSSNGSTSMAATCATSMALMAAGVPLPKHVGGIGVGLVTDDNDESNYKLLLDIEGIEDFYGDMDFKVTGTRDGITAIQFETKLKGVAIDIIKKAFRLSKTGRDQVIDVMSAAIAGPRAETPENAPKVDVIQIPQDKIGELIGPGGKNVKGIVEAANALGGGQLEIDINDDGRVTITAVSKAQRDFALSRINMISEEPEIGKIYEGEIDKVMTYGAFVDVTPNISGLIHVSELAEGFVKDPNDVVKEGDKVKVKLIKIEGGKQSFSIKAVGKQG